MPATDWKEIIPDGEAEKFEGYARELGEMQARRARGGSLDRALHAKGNLGLLAEFEVVESPLAEARVGMFATPKKYDAIVRFSNGGGKRASDKRPDVRGIAVKVIGVDGKKLIPGMEDAVTQDFLAIRTPSVPVRNADEFFKLVRAAESPALVPFKLIGGLGFGRGFGLLRAVLKSLKVPQLPLASTAYYTAVPVSFGPLAAMIAFVPQEAGEPTKDKAPDHLGDALAARLRDKPVVYDVRARFFENEAATPIEDASVEWTTPLHTIGKLTILAQDPASPRGKKIADYVETLAFDPWHARTDLRPIGSMMRARNAAYRVSTKARTAAPEPTALPTFD